MIRRAGLPLLACWLTACTAAAPPLVQTPSGATARPGAMAAPVAAAPHVPSAAFKKAIHDAQVAIAAREASAVDQQLALATRLAGDDPHQQWLAAYTRATAAAYAGDYEKSAAAIVAVIPSLALHPELSDEFWAHNTLMMVREAEGDPTSALIENAEATGAASRGAWDTPAERERLRALKDSWHRAYLIRMLAEDRTGRARARLVAYAQASLAEYVAIARGAKDNEDSIAVLEGYFAALDHDQAAAIRAAKRVDLAADDDSEDLYLLAAAYRTGGDAVGASAAASRIRNVDAVDLPHAIMLRWMDKDAVDGGGFTPLHPHVSP